MADAPARLRCTSSYMLDPARHPSGQIHLVIPEWYQSTDNTTKPSELSLNDILGLSSMLTTSASYREMYKTFSFRSTLTPKSLIGRYVDDYLNAPDVLIWVPVGLLNDLFAGLW